MKGGAGVRGLWGRRMHNRSERGKEGGVYGLKNQ